MALLSPDTCHLENTIVYDSYELPSARKRPAAMAPRLDVINEVEFLGGKFALGQNTFGLGIDAEQELVIALMGLTPDDSAQIFGKEPRAAQATLRGLLRHFGAKQQHELPPTIFDGKHVRIVKTVQFPVTLSADEHRIITLLSTGLSGDEISGQMQLDRKDLDTAVFNIRDQAGTHNLAGLKTLGWLSGLAIGSPGFPAAVQSSAAELSATPRLQLFPAPVPA